MTREEFENKHVNIVSYCEENHLEVETWHRKREIDFYQDFGANAIDLSTLESPNCVYVTDYIFVRLPIVDKDKCRKDGLDWGDAYDKYQIVAERLTNIARPDYIIGAKEGIIMGVLYCVWE